MIPSRAGALLLAWCCAAAAGAAAPERYVVVDADARQPGVDGFPGALFVYDRESNALSSLCADPRFADPQNVIVDDDGTLLVVDFAADPAHTGRAHGAVFRVDPRAGKVVRAYTSELFVAPTSLARGPGRALFVTDRRARAGAKAGQGAVFAINLDSGACRALAAGAPFRAPSDLAYVDGEGLYVLDADAPGARPGDEGVLFRLDVVTGTVETVARLEGAISPLGLLREPEGTWLVFDANADPLRQGGPLGAIFRLDPRTRETSLLASDLRFRDPVRGCFAADGAVLFVDANADPEKRGPDAAGRGQNLTGPGALMRFDPKKNTLDVLASPAGCVNPVAIRRLP